MAWWRRAPVLSLCMGFVYQGPELDVGVLVMEYYNATVKWWMDGGLDMDILICAPNFPCGFG